MVLPRTAMTMAKGLRSVGRLQFPAAQAFRSTRRSFASEAKSDNPTSQFYKQFTRPVAKTLLLAVLTYQLAYWAWVKLEQDEVRAKRDGTIAQLEASVKEYDVKVKAADGKSS